MLRLTSGRLAIVLTIMLAAVLFVSPVYAQQTGSVRGKVVDGAGKPLEKAKVVIASTENANRVFEVQSNKKGEFIRIGLQPGQYKLTASFPNLGEQTFDARVRLGDPVEINFMLGGGGTGQMSKEDAAKAAALKAVFELGVTASKAGDYDGAIAKFTEASGLVPNCFDCFYNMGYAYMQKKDYAQAEAQYLKAIELKNNYVDAYNGLATVYNAQKNFDKAAEMGAKAAELAAAAGPGGSGGVDAEYNQGVILWNAGKIAEARTHFEKVIFMKPEHADAHYQIGMANLNEGKMAEAAAMFEQYLQLAPDGQYAAMVKGILPQLKK
jgi:tetratricopeptide (TPR) repeat protein